jgi:hypothetical protein
MTCQLAHVCRKSWNRNASNHKKAKLLEGVCSEAAELLKDLHFAAGMGVARRRMKPTRQIEAVELMLAANKITVAVVGLSGCRRGGRYWRQRNCGKLRIW